MKLLLRIEELSKLKVNDNVQFTCNGRGRGGHYSVFGVVTKVNRKTIRVVERKGSYRPGQIWQVAVNPEYPVYRYTN